MLNKLVRGNKYTIIGNDGCLEFNLQITLLDFMYKQYAQYEAVPYITYKKKGGKKVYTMFLSWKYCFIEGWEKVEMTNKIDDISSQRIKYDDINLDNYNIALKGYVGETIPYKEYESLIDHSFNLILEHGKDTEEYRKGLKEVFTRLNFSLSNDMINYYKREAEYFINSLKLLEISI